MKKAFTQLLTRESVGDCTCLVVFVVHFEYLGNQRVKTQRGLLCTDVTSLTEVPEYRWVHIEFPGGVKNSIQHI